MTRTVLVSCLGMTLVFLLGCRDEGPDFVRTQVPRIEKKIVPVEKDRLIAVLVTEKNKTWSFKMSGPESAVAAHKEKFDDWLRSIKFGDKPPVAWKTPEGWEAAPAGDAIIFARLKTGPEPKTLEATVVELPKEGGELLPNVNRWLDQLALPPVKEAQLADLAKDVEIDGRKGKLVDLVGRFGPKGNMPQKKPPVPRKRVDDRDGPGKVTYALPAAWAKVKPKNSMIQEQFDIVDGEDRAETTINVLPGDAGGNLANVMRWRGQILLPPTKDADQVQKDMLPIETKSGKGIYVDLNNPAAPGNNRILGVLVQTPRATYFLKMMGPSELVGREKTRFEEFAKSLKID